jgi:hypothetical protein
MLAFVGCGSTSHTGGPDNAAVDANGCPGARESAASKISHEDYLRAHTDETQGVTVWLRPLPWANAACATAAGSENCANRDEALTERETANSKQVECVLASFGPEGSIKQPHAAWYEPLQTPVDGPPTPIGTAFSLLALSSQIELAARHPYVERIEPAFGEAGKLGVAAPTVPGECPSATEAPDVKLVDAASIVGAGRMPVVIELRESLLPPIRPCAGEAACDDFFASGWERTVASTRQLTCVRSHIESVLQAAAPEVAYRSVDAIVDGPKLPPFNDSIHATLAFGLGLTWDEASATAQHPYVERIWTSDGLSFGDLPEGCPPDYDSPVVVPPCSSETEPTTGKFSAEAAAAWQASSEPNEVLISVRRSTPICPRPACPGRGSACPEADRYFARLLEEAKASQACIRSLITSIGGTATDDVFTFGDGLMALLSWPQIEIVAAHPDVVSMVPNDTAPLP